MPVHKYTAHTILILDVDLEKNFVELCDNNGLLLSKRFARMLIEYLEGYINENTDEEIEAENKLRALEDEKHMAEILEARDSRPAKKGFVYLATDSNRGFIKIGFTTNVKARITQLKVANAGVEYLSHFDGTYEDEQHLHTHFKTLGKRISSEWFSLGNADIEFIENFFNRKAA